MRARFWRGRESSHNLNRDAKGPTIKPVLRGFWSRLAGLTLVALLLGLALEISLRPVRPLTARAQARGGAHCGRVRSVSRKPTGPQRGARTSQSGPIGELLQSNDSGHS